MSKTDLTEKFWFEFCAQNPEISRYEPYQVWFFHHQRESSKNLAELVVARKKQATASLMESETDVGDGGIVGGYSVVTDFDGNPQCIIQTTEVRALSFRDVDTQFAFDEGEGDRTLEYWRDAHRKFFTECCAELKIEFNESMAVCCKRFKTLFPKL